MGDRVIKFRAWDKENNKYFEPTREAFRGRLEDIVVGMNGRFLMRNGS